MGKLEEGNCWHLAISSGHFWLLPSFILLIHFYRDDKYFTSLKHPWQDDWCLVSFTHPYQDDNRLKSLLCRQDRTAEEGQRLIGDNWITSASFNMIVNLLIYVHGLGTYVQSSHMNGKQLVYSLSA